MAIATGEVCCLWTAYGESGRTERSDGAYWYASLVKLLSRLSLGMDGEYTVNFPMEYPLFRFLYWLINTPGIGGIAVLLVGGGSLTAYFLALRWITRSTQSDDAEVYTFPTPSLLEHDEFEQ
jgi:hypothetical protein